METIELFGETLRYDESWSDGGAIVWQGPTFRLLHYQYFDGTAMWALAAEGRNLFLETYGHATVAEAARHLAEGLLDESEERAQVARRILAGLSVELKGGEQ